MIYKDGTYYFMEPTDEIITFNPNVHTKFEFEPWFANNKKLSPMELLLLSFFHKYACDVWHKTEHHPDHDIAIRVTHADLAELFNVEEKEISKAIQNLIEYELLGVVLIPNGIYAYHIVL